MENLTNILNTDDVKKLQEKIFHDRVKVLHDLMATTSIPATFVCATVLLIGLYRDENKTILIAWFISMMLISIFRLYLLHLYRRKPTEERLHLNLFIFGSTLAALVWSIAGTMLLPENNIGGLILTIIIIVGITAGGSQTLQASRIANMLFMIILILPLGITLMLEKESSSLALSVAVFGYLVFMLELAQKGYTQLIESIRFRHINVMLVKKLSGINDNLMKEISERIKTQEQLDYLATHDSLTRIPNRYFFHLLFKQTLERAQHDEKKFTLLFIDIDHFKMINDRYGHDTGDLLLYQVAMRLKKHLRKDDAIARMGGDEFIILLDDCQEEECIEKFIKRINRLFKLPFHVREHQLFISLSIGISIYPQDGDNKNTLLKKADIALYRAKETGRNKTEFYNVKFTPLPVKD